MHLPRLRSLASLLAGASLLGSAALASTPGAGSGAGEPVVSDAAPRLVNHFVSSCIGYCKHPTNAGKVFRWGLEDWEEEAERANLDNTWRSNHPSLVGNQHGMLTLLAGRHGVVSATEQARGRAVGRWETRIRHRQYVHRNTPYRVLVELVPAGDRPGECGARNVALAAYTPGGKAATHYIHTRPDNRYVARKRLNLTDNQWHTFAVEVTEKRISWFVDAHVISTEKRKEALSGVPFAVRYTMQPEGRKTMNESRIQMDWLRYWTLENPNKRSTAAKRPKAGTNRDACAAR